MNPKEKAIELYEFYIFYTTKDDCTLYLNHSTSKYFANRCIDEVINSLNENEIGSYAIDWWNEVKNEIDKL